MPETTKRVERNTAEKVNRRIRSGIADSIRWHEAHPEAIDRRLKDLDEEWNIERALEANAATLALTGVALSLVADRRWLVVPGIVAAFLLQHAVQGWCPPLPILRGLGYRTAREINTERSALKAIRGDFERVEGAHDRSSAALRASLA